MGPLFKPPELADAIEAVRQEVIRAQLQVRTEGLSFRVGPVEMEFEVVLARGGDYKAALQVLVVTEDTLGGTLAERTRGEVTTHRVKLTLEPIGESSEPLV